jgi:hypothetical protein
MKLLFSTSSWLQLSSEPLLSISRSSWIFPDSSELFSPSLLSTIKVYSSISPVSSSFLINSLANIKESASLTVSHFMFPRCASPPKRSAPNVTDGVSFGKGIVFVANNVTILSHIGSATNFRNHGGKVSHLKAEQREIGEIKRGRVTSFLLVLTLDSPLSRPTN